jgi:NAD(P)-dependent dehydrogenase (short-subunit alcohol dehydrogenase family)
MSIADLAETTAVVTGASRGFGRAIATSLVARGAHVVGVARSDAQLEEVHQQLGDSFIPVVADLADDTLAARMIADYRPRLVVLNAGATPVAAPLQEQTWERFSQNWEVDVQHVFRFVRQALISPLPPGSMVISFSSGAALRGSPLSGGYAGAKATIRFLSSYAGAEAERNALGIRFVSILPQITPATQLGAPFVDAYADYAGLSVDAYLAQFGGTLTTDQVADGVVALATDDAYDAAAYALTAAGMNPVE